MSRKTTRRLSRSPSGAHVLAQRDETGQVQYTELATTTGNTGVSDTAFQTTVGTPATVLVEKVVASLTGVGAGNQASVKLKHDGNTVASSTANTAATLSTTQTYTTPDVVEHGTVEATATSGSGTFSVGTWSREQQWV